MEKIVKLLELENGAHTAVYKVNEFDKKMNRRLIELGFVKNEKIEVIKNLKKSKSMLISIRGYVLSLDYIIAERVMVWKV